MVLQCFLGPLTPATPEEPGAWTENTPGHWCVPTGQDFMILNGGGLGVCCVEGQFDPNTGPAGEGSYELGVGFELAGQQAITPAAFVTAFGTDHPAIGASQTINVGGAGVSLTILGPSANLRIGGQTGALLYRIDTDGDDDGLPAGFRICFDRPVSNVQFLNSGSVLTGGVCPLGIQGLAVKAPIEVTAPEDRVGCC